MPLSRPPSPPAPQQPDSKELQQAASLPSMPRAAGGRSDASRAGVQTPPPGLIAPLSPRLAVEEEEVEEEEEDLFNSQSFRGNRWSSVAAEKKTRKSHPVKLTKCSAKRPGSTACQRRMMNDEVIQSKERSSVQNFRGETWNKTEPAARIQHIPAEREAKKMMVEEDGVRPVETEWAARPRRKAVGPPIRYLIESEEQSHGHSAANSSRAKGTKVCDQPPLQPHPTVHGAGSQLSCLLCHKKFSCAGSLLHHYSNPGGCPGNEATHGSIQVSDSKQEDEVDIESDGERNERDDRSKEEQEEQEKALFSAPSSAPGPLRYRTGVHRHPWWGVAYQTTQRRRQDIERWRRQQERDGAGGRKRKWCRVKEEVKQVCLEEEGEGERRGDGGGEEREMGVKEVMKQPQRPRRKMVGPPIRYLLESEFQSHGLLTSNQDRKRVFKEGRKQQKKSEARGGATDHTAMIDRLEDTEQTDRQTITERQTCTSHDKANTPKPRRRKPEEVVIDSEAGGGASEMTDSSEDAGQQTGHMVAGRQTDSYRSTYLMHTDLKSGSVTIAPPCCVRLQRLL